ncbi:MAG TPA: glycosyltransferase [Bacteroidales bacterium]|nr:glycosyltransferase [Bacteroidales bacterium]HOX77478.1 glycosyltransferase [Bacteroidales bacterium]HPM92989.1 glycosyltransferase [Bacteroidales bacterium]
MTGRYKRLAMLSTHGYFDPIPLLGETDTGGQVLYVLELSKALARRGIKVDIYTRWFDRNRSQIELLPGYPDVRVIRIPAGPWEFVIKEKIYSLLPELTENLAAFLRENRLDYDLFHGHYVDAGIVTVDLARIFGKPAFFTAHSLGAWKRERMDGDPEQMELEFNFNHRIEEEKRIYRTLPGHTVTSRLQLDKLRELYGYEEDNVEIIPPGVNIHKFKPLNPGEPPKKTNLPEKYIFCLSRVDSNKGYDLLLNAFGKVCQKMDDVYLVTGGGSSNPQPREKEVIDMMLRIMKEKGIENKVIFVGHVEEHLMVPYYQNAQFFVMPSIFEPFGMTTQEAMASGIPVIASKFGGINTVLTHEKDGLLIDPKNEDEFAGAMIRLLEETAFRKQLGQKASSLIRQNYSWEAMAEKHLHFYKKYV